MKHFYKVFLSLVAAVIVVAGAWAMHVTKHASAGNTQTEFYYHYLGNTATLAAYQTQSNWELVQSPTEPGCSGSELPCVVQSTQSSVPAFVSTITQVSDVTANTIVQKDAE